jgi:hypothetical protein
MLDARQGTVLTYSSASAVRGAIIDAGFHVWRSPALGGKSGGTVGTILPASAGSYLHELSADEKARLRSSSGVPYRDPTFQAARELIRERRLSEQFEFRSQRH